MRQLKRKSKIRFLSLLTTGLLYLSLCLSANVYAATPNPSVPVEVTDEVYKSEPVIVSEDTSLRGEYEKHFQKSDGSYAVATYTMPVHYQDEATGEWNEIDNRLVESVDKNGGVVYRNRDGLFDVSFARTPGANPADLVTMESEGHTISWKLISSDNTIHKVKSADYTNNGREDLVLTGTAAEILDISAADSAPVSKMAAEKTVSALVYNDLADQDTDVRFTVTPLKVKEDFLLDKAPDEAISYTTLLYLSDGLTPTVLEHGDISVTDEDGREIFCIASPYMTDAADEMSADIAVDFKRDGDGWRLTVTPDLAWLQDDARVYPVTVDPTVYATNNAANTWDTYIYEDSTSSGGRSRQDLDRMYVGNRSSAQKKCRGLIKFLTMPTISGTITGATLTLTTPSGTSTWQGMTLYRITEDWVSESVTWAEQPYASFIQSQTANGGKYVFDVTTAIRDMYRYSTAASSNYGFEVCYTNESINDYNSICSSEHGTDTDVNSTKPYLVIHYDYYAPNPTPGIVSGAYYFIRSVNSGKYMDVTNFGGNTTSVIQHGLNRGTNQQWRVVYHAEGWYSLAPVHNLNLRLDVPGGNRVNGQDLWVYNSNNTSTQRWRIIPNGDGSYRLMPMCAQHENMVIDVDSASQSNGAALQLWTWDGVSPQMKWTFEMVKTVHIRHFYDDGYAARYPGTGDASPSSKIAGYQKIISDYFRNVFQVELTYEVIHQRSEVDACTHGGASINTYCQKSLNGTCDYTAGRCHCTNAANHLFTLPQGVNTIPGANGRIVKWTGHKLCEGCPNNGHTSKSQSVCGGTRIAIQWGDLLTPETRDNVTIGSIAHELGHSFGCIGDNSDTCTNTTCVMRYYVNDQDKVDNLTSYNPEAYCSLCRSKIISYIQTQL